MLVKAVTEPNGVLACSRLLFVLLVVEPENAAHCVELSCCLAAAGGVVVVAIRLRLPAVWRLRHDMGVLAVPLVLLVWPQRPACRLLRAVRSLPAAVGLVELATLRPPMLAEALNHRR